MQDSNTQGKLLKIQTSLLEALFNEMSKTTKETINYEQIRLKLEDELEKYKELVTNVDKELYHELQEKILKIKKDKLTLEEELKILEEFEVFYNQFIKIQTTFKETYKKYSDRELELLSQEDLNVRSLFKRKSYIRGYLNNKEELKKCKINIEEYNKKLSEQEKISNKVAIIIDELDQKLIEDMNSLEGRLISKNGKLSYTSIKEEYASIGVYLTNDGYTGLSLSEASKESQDAKEKLSVATISYDVLPNSDNLAILNDIKLETIVSNYKLALLKIVSEVYKKSQSYEDAITKREKINDLLRYRSEYLVSLGIKYGIDPFTRLNVMEQISKINSYENTSQNIIKLRGLIAKLNTKIEELEISNNEYLIQLDNYELIVEPKYIKKDNSNDSMTFDDTLQKVIELDISASSNQVVAISLPSQNLNIGRCREKAYNVIIRIFDLLTRKRQKSKSNPELVIDKISSIHTEENKLGEMEKDTSIKSEDSEDIFSVADKIFAGEDEIFEEVIPFDQPKDSSDLFQELVPFDGPSLYSNKQEDLFEDVKVPFENKEDSVENVNNTIADYSLEMPELDNNDNQTEFWSSQSGYVRKKVS